ncbi:MAG: DUF87 domain-containing protein [Candidatus Nanohaloarchaeota archaeon QJJ-9]|nr:DUF87 domain-containing protein [Candidatus Nanohaloarchaeota archaeon QJJ-9]
MARIGTVEGAVNTEKFKFEAHKEIEKFDFVTVKANTDEAEWLLAQVDEVEKKPIKDSEKVDKAYKTIASANIIGYRVNGLLKKPRSVIEPDSIVYKADQETISKTLGLDDQGLYVGNLVTNPGINICLDPEELYKHIAVLAKTGAGKSYATGVMIEELLEKDYPVVVIDPHGEYHSLKEPNSLDKEEKECYGIQEKGYPTKEYSPNTDLNEEAEELSFSSRNMDAKELQQVIPTSLTNSQLGVLYTALKDLREREEYSLDDVIDTCMDQDSKAKWNLINLLETVRDSGIFSEKPTPKEELLEKGRASIVNLRGVDPEKQETVVYQLSKELFEARKKGELEPFIMIIEEAHNFVPEKGMGKAVCSDILRKIASEGRKFGLGIGVISQRPANVAKNILSQCNTQLIMRVTNPNDLSAISRSFEGVTSEVEDSITSLPPGTGLVLGKEYPIMTDIRTRKSKHGGETKEVSEEQGLEKREDTKKVAESLTDKAEEEEVDLSMEEVEEDDESLPEEEEYTDKKAPEPEVGDMEVEKEREETGSIDMRDYEEKESSQASLSCFRPEMEFSEIDEKLDNPVKAFYPIYLVETEVGSLAIDGTDGEVKSRDLSLTKEAEEVISSIKEKRRTSTSVAEELGFSKEKVEDILERLVELGLADERDKKFVYTDIDLFDRQVIDTEVGEGTIIDTEISEDRAEEVAEEILDEEAKEVDTVYYPYYTSGKRVFDAVLGKEV